MVFCETQLKNGENIINFLVLIDYICKLEDNFLKKRIFELYKSANKIYGVMVYLKPGTMHVYPAREVER